MKVRQKSYALGLAGAVVVALAGCTSTPAAQQEAPKAITVALPAISTPYTASNQSNAALRITSNVFDPLLFWDQASGEFKPGIATDWEQISDTELDLTIREGVTFHDGTKLTAKDVAFTLSEERLWGKEALEPSSLASTFAAVEAVDEDTVKITTKAPDPALLERLASTIGFVVPQALIEDEGIEAFGAHPVGTGPYKVVEVNPGESVKLEANEDYWGGEATYDMVTFTEVAEVSARVSGLATGEYSIATNLPPDQVGVVEGNGQQISTVEVNNVVMLALMTAKADSPVADVRVRQAMELALDRQTLAETLWSGLASVPDGFNLPVYQDFYDKSSTANAQNLDEAKALLKEAGYAGEPITIRYINGYYTNFDKAMEVMLTQWADAGITVKAEGVADYTLLDYPTLDGYATSSNVALTDPISPLWTDWGSPSSVYVSQGRGLPSAELTSAAETLATSLDADERSAAYEKATELWREEVPAISIWQPVDIYGIGHGIDFTPDARYWLRLAPVPAS